MSDTPTIIRPDDPLTHKGTASNGTAVAAPQPGGKEAEPLSSHPL